MAKSKRTPLERIQKGKSKDIARIFFLHYFPTSSVTRILYPKACRNRKDKTKSTYHLPIIQNYLSEWKKVGFIDAIDMKIPIEKKNNISYLINGKGYRLTLEPLYSFCKTKNINFTSEEKSLIDTLLNPTHIRQLIVREYPKEDIINAILRFYVSHYIMLYKELYLIRNSKELFDKGYKKLLKKKEQEVKKLSQKNIGIERKELIDEIFKFNEKLKSSEKSSEKMYIESLIHMIKYKDNPKLIFDIDRKFMKALGILP